MKARRSAGHGWAVGLAWLALACGQPDAARVYPARGIVLDVHPEYGQVVVQHDDIPGLMSAMSMNFDVADPALLEQLEPGQAIEFELEVTPRSYRIVKATVSELDLAAGAGLGLARAVGAAEPAPDFQLIDQDGAPLALSALRGKAVLLDFIYTRCPGPCPILTGLHVEAQGALPPRLRERSHFVSISLDPAHDTPEVLGAYARARGADLAQWSFLTGPVEEVEAVVESYGVGTVRQPSGEIDHLVITFLIDPAGRIARRYTGLDTKPETLARDLERLLQRGAASQSKRGRGDG